MSIEKSESERLFIEINDAIEQFRMMAEHMTAINETDDEIDADATRIRIAANIRNLAKNVNPILCDVAFLMRITPSGQPLSESDYDRASGESEENIMTDQTPGTVDYYPPGIGQPVCTWRQVTHFTVDSSVGRKYSFDAIEATDGSGQRQSFQCVVASGLLLFRKPVEKKD